ncbi:MULTISPECIES: AzlD family protein [Pseudovibrio]|uniref:AzlD family protein n=1 Tax=Stappiaceae TaxID=2821832 RepID=UPI00236532E7|nr:MULTISPECIES: AzlD family protein [Pseudovibrio]MDD7910337.1 AzlD family protein [Pseudovibrio exalbescens]MDX5594052.1 AzlD family protein [Pseudovibrio sp. SPO723]
MMEELFATDVMSLWTIFLMGLSTYVTRIAGVYVLRYVTLSGRMEEALKAVPPAIFMSIIAPVAFMTGPAETISAALTAVVAMRAPLLPSICVGVICVAFLRQVI